MISNLQFSILTPLLALERGSCAGCAASLEGGGCNIPVIFPSRKLNLSATYSLESTISPKGRQP